MPDHFATVADPTALEWEPQVQDRTLLAVYIEGAPGATQILPLADGAEVTFGRTRVATVMVDSDRISRLHARVTRAGDRVTVEDLGSRNGTRVNGARIVGPTALSSGDQIELGPATVVVTITSSLARRARLGSAGYLEDRLRAEADRGARYKRTFGLLVLELSGPVAAIDAAVDRIARQTRAMDTIAEYGPREIALLLPERDEDEVRAIASRLVEEARALPIPVELRAGLAVFPRHAARADDLLSHARSALAATRAPGAAPVAAPAAHAAAPLAAGEPIVSDPQMRRVYTLVEKVADSPMTVLIVGETGVGKEVVAEALHRASARRAATFVRLNCACLPETLLESELFGHERGAFTGAERRKLGFFEAAAGGTIFLDEIGEITPAVQAKLLRVLQEHKITRVGGTQEIAVDVRVVCATNRDLEAEVRRGAFREDLFFRIGAFTILVPPLRDRRGEVLPLAERFAAAAATAAGQRPPSLSPAVRDVLLRYAWPGNVRELRNALERAVVLSSGGVIEPEDLPERVREEGNLRGPPAALPVLDAPGFDVNEQIAEVERASILAALEACEGNQTRAARKLGLSRRALIYRMEKHGLKPPPGGGRDDE